MSYRSDSLASASSARRLAQGLGWFSIALGALEVLAPRALGRVLGMPDSAPLLFAYGVREIASGVAILSADDPAPGIWARVGGDALDLATLAAGLGEDNPRRHNVGLALAAVGAVTVLDVICAQALSADGRSAPMADYSDRRGMPEPPEVMRGIARDALIPPDMRTPELLRPFAG